MARLITSVARDGDRSPASILFLSGDVHYSYLAEADIPGATVYQLVCSPIRNPLPKWLRVANVIGSVGVARLLGRPLAAAAKVPRNPFTWRIGRGPWSSNALGVLDVRDRTARVRWLTADARSGTLRELGNAQLTP